MKREKEVDFLFAIAKEMKLSYECPVLFLTQVDYADDLYRTLASLHTALHDIEAKERITEIINAFHFAWLHSLHQIETWKKRSKDVPRETILKTPDYTIKSIKYRHSRFEKFYERTIKFLTQSEKAKLDAETNVIKDLREINISALLEKDRCLGNAIDKTEFTMLVTDETNELLNWLDRLYNFVALQICNLLDLKRLPEELSKTLHEAVEKMSQSLQESSAICIGKSHSSDGRLSINDNDITKINSKIRKLQDAISQLKTEKPESNNTLAVQHKVIFLGERLESLQNLKTSLSYFQKKESDESEEGHVPGDNTNVIFDHLLPHDYRCRLVEDLIQSWNNTINNLQANSLISVMDTGDPAEEFTDEYGKFAVDDYGRKMYKSKSGNSLYQLDGSNTLVPVEDDEEHIYFYDAVGRYYLTEAKERVYKAHARASEYILDYTGRLLKLKETVDGVEYNYDNIGRYYIHKNGQRIYCDPNSTDEYVNDGFGNLVKVRYEEEGYITDCPVEPIAAEESLYLKKTVGEALKKCVAEVCMLAPVDPIKYLGERLLKYHNDMVIAAENKLKEVEMHAERDRMRSLEREKALKEAIIEPSLEEESLDDSSGTGYNFLNYTTGTEV